MVMIYIYQPGNEERESKTLHKGNKKLISGNEASYFYYILLMLSHRPSNVM